MKRSARRLFAVGLLLPVAAVAAWVVYAYTQFKHDRASHELLQAVKQGNVGRAATLLAAGADPNVRDSSETWQTSFVAWLRDTMAGKKRAPTEKADTALMLTVESSKTEMVRLLLEHGADPNVRGRNEATPLMRAAFGTSAIPEMLLNRNADVNAADADGRTALMTMCGWGEPEDVGLLLNHKARVDAQDSDGYTALLYAVGKGNLENVKPLLAHHVNVNVRARDGRTALSIAESYPQTHDKSLSDEDWDECARLLKHAGAQK